MRILVALILSLLCASAHAGDFTTPGSRARGPVPDPGIFKQGVRIGEQPFRAYIQIDDDDGALDISAGGDNEDEVGDLKLRTNWVRVFAPLTTFESDPSEPPYFSIRIDGTGMLDGSDLGGFQFIATDEAGSGNPFTYVDFTVTAVDATSLTEDAALDIAVITAGGLNPELRLTGAALSPLANAGLDLGIDDTNRFQNLFLDGTQLQLDDRTALRFVETEANGDNYVEFIAPTTLTGNTTCTFENDANPIPDSCVGDGTDGGGGISNVVEDTTPQLGGDLDLNAFDVTTTNVASQIILNPNSNAAYTGISVDNDSTGGSATASISVTQGSNGPLSITCGQATGCRLTSTQSFDIFSNGGSVFIATAGGGWGVDTNGALAPNTDAVEDIGTTALGVNNLHFDTGAIINYENGDVLLTHASNRLTLTGGDFWTSGAFSTLVMEGTDPGTGANAALLMFANSASPAANDVIGQFRFRGNDAAAAATDYASVQGTILDTTDASEDGRLDLAAFVAGTSTVGMRVSDGVIVGNSTTLPGAGNLLADGDLQSTDDVIVGDDILIGDADAINWNSGDTTLTKITDGLAVSGDDPTFFVIGHSASIGSGSLQVHGVATAATMQIGRWSDDANPPRNTMFKGSSGTIGNFAVVSDDEQLGEFQFVGADGTDGAVGATIAAFVDGSPGADDMPARLELRTSLDGTQSSLSRVTINNAGTVVVGTSLTDPISFHNSGQGPAQVQALGTTGTTGLNAARFSNDAFPTRWNLAKSRGTSVGSFTIVNDLDLIGEINFEMADGTDLGTGAFIRGYVDGAVASAGDTSDTPGALALGTTPDGADTPVTRVVIDSTGGTRFGDNADSDPGNGNVAIDDSGAFRLYETEANGDNFFALIAPDALGGDVTCTIDASGRIPDSCVGDGTDAGGAPGGSDTHVQYNDGGVFGGDAGMTYNETTDALTVVGDVSGADILAGDDLAAVDDILTTAGTIMGGFVDSTAGNGNIGIDDQGNLAFFEAEANGDNSFSFVTPAAFTSDVTCTFENDANPIPDSCVGDGTDGGGGLSDGDKVDITVSNSGADWNIDPDATISGTTPLITIIGTSAGATGPVLVLDHDSASPVGTDIVGTINFNGEDGAGGDDTYGQIQTEIVTESAGTEASNMIFSTKESGTLAPRMIVDPVGVQVLGQLQVSGVAAFTSSLNSNSPFASENDDDENYVVAGRFGGDRSTPTDGDTAAILLYLEDDDSSQTAGQIQWTLDDVTDGDEDSHITFKTILGGVEATRFSIGANGPGVLASQAVVTAETFVVLPGFADTTGVTFTGLGPATSGATFIGAGGPAEMQYLNVDVGAVGMVEILEHDSTTPAVNDVPGRNIYRGRDSGASDTDYVQLYVTLLNVTDTTEAAKFSIDTLVGGANAQRLSVGDGVIVGSSTTFPGAGSMTLDNDLFLTTGDKIDFNAGDVTITHAADTLDFSGAATAYTFQSGPVVIGHSASVPNMFGFASDAQVISSGASELGIFAFSTNDAVHSEITLNKSATASVGVHAVVAVDEKLGGLDATGSDGTDYEWATSVGFYVDGTPNDDATDMPGRIELHTSPDGTDQPVARLVVKQDGGVIVGPNDTSGGAKSLTIDDQGTLEFGEAEANGDSAVTFAAPAALGSDRTCVFEDDANPIPDSCVGDGTDGGGAFDGTAITTVTWGTNNFTTHVHSTDGVDMTWDYTTVDGAAMLTGGGTSPILVLDDDPTLQLREEDGNGSNFLGFSPPAAITSDQTCVLEDDASFIPDSCVGDGTDGGGASLALDNLASVAINTSLVSDTDNTDDLGTAAIGWRDIFITSDIEFNGDTGTTLTAPAAGRLTIEGVEIPTIAGTGLTATTNTFDCDGFSETAVGCLELATTAEADTGTDTQRAVTPAGVLAAVTGRQTIPLQAAGGTVNVGGTIVPCTFVSSFDSGSQDVFMRQCSFAAAADNALYFTFFFPKGANESTDLVVQIDWTSATATDATDDVIWTASAVCFSNDDPINGNAFPAVDTVTDTQTAAGDYLVSGEITAITPAGTPTEGDGCVLRITRDADAGGDNFNGTADLIQARLFYATSNENDD